MDWEFYVAGAPVFFWSLYNYYKWRSGRKPGEKNGELDYYVDIWFGNAPNFRSFREHPVILSGIWLWVVFWIVTAVITV